MSLDTYSATAAGIAHGLSRKLNMRVVLQPGANPHTDCHNVLVLPPPMSQKPEDLAAWHGMADHECGHALWTDSGAKDGLDDDEAHAINALEDAHLNARLAKEYRGTGSNLRAAYTQIAAATEELGPKGATMCAAMHAVAPDIFGPMAQVPRNPQTEESWQKGAAWGRTHRDAILNRSKTGDLRELARELAKLAQEEAEKQEQEPDSEGDSDKPAGGEGDKDGEQDTDDNSKDDNSKDGKDGEDGDGKQDRQAGAPENTKEGENDGKPDKKPKRNDAPPGMEDLGKKIAEDSKGQELPKLMGGTSTLSRHRLHTGETVHPLSAFVGSLGRGLAGDLRVAVQTRTNRRRIGDQVEGADLDDNNLADVARRQPDVRAFENRTRCTYPDTAIILVVDGSTSMNREATNPAGDIYGSMYRSAMGAGYAIAASLALVPKTQLAVWTNRQHDSARQGGTSTIWSKSMVLCDWGHKPSERDLASWSNVTPQAGAECWGANIRRATRELLKRRCKRRIVVLVTDGNLTWADVANGDYPGDLVLADQMAQKYGVEVYGVAWGDQADWQGLLPKDRSIEARNVKTPSRDWLKSVSKLLLKGSK